MKSAALQSVKFSRLKRRLKLPQWQVVGLLESLWLFTQINAPRGDIGRFTNEDIAAAMEWDGDHDLLMEVLVECEWLDMSPRLVLPKTTRKFFRRDRRFNARRDLTSKAYRRLRLVVIAEQGTTCTYCQCDCSDDPTIDHVNPVGPGVDPLDKSNLVVCCRPCNSRKGNR